MGKKEGAGGDTALEGRGVSECERLLRELVNFAEHEVASHGVGACSCCGWHGGQHTKECIISKARRHAIRMANMRKHNSEDYPFPIGKYCQGCMFQERHMGIAYCKDAFAGEDNGPVIIVTKKLHSDGVDYLRCEECLRHNCKY